MSRSTLTLCAFTPHSWKHILGPRANLVTFKGFTKGHTLDIQAFFAPPAPSVNVPGFALRNASTTATLGTFRRL